MDKYLELKNEIDAQNWLNENYSNYLPTIKLEHPNLYDALCVYTGNLSKMFNILLFSNKGVLDGLDELIDKNYRKDDICYNDYKKSISLIYNSFNQNLCDNIILYHYLNNRTHNITFKKGSTFYLNKFISTTVLKNNNDVLRLRSQNKYDILFKIYAKKGTKCIPYGNNPNSKLNEYEIILHPKTKLLVKKINNDFFKSIKVVECEIID